MSLTRMQHDWQILTQLTGGSHIEVERVRVTATGVHIEGQFELPPLARLTNEDQIFVSAFVRSHGSIKQMEKLFGVSYPTIKNRLNRIAEQLPFADVATEHEAPAPGDDLLSRLERGEMTAKEVLEVLNTNKGGA